MQHWVKRPQPLQPAAWNVLQPWARGKEQVFMLFFQEAQDAIPVLIPKLQSAGVDPADLAKIQLLKQPWLKAILSTVVRDEAALPAVVHKAKTEPRFPNLKILFM